jgi:predicted RNA-binding protein YlxR (DUF448 family)
VRVPIASTDKKPNEANSTYDQNQIQLDHGMGRSAYLCKKLECLQLAQKKNRLGRSLRTQIPPEIFDILKSRL